MEEQLLDLQDAIINGSKADAVELTQSLIDLHADPQTILNQGLIAGMTEVGRMFTCGEYFVPEMLIAA